MSIININCIICYIVTSSGSYDCRVFLGNNYQIACTEAIMISFTFQNSHCLHYLPFTFVLVISYGSYCHRSTTPQASNLWCCNLKQFYIDKYCKKSTYIQKTLITSFSHKSNYHCKNWGLAFSWIK